MILRSAPLYIELKTIYSLVKPKVIKLHNEGKIDEETFSLLSKIDEGLPKLDKLANIFYENAINDNSQLSEQDFKLINNTIHDITSLLMKALPIIIL